jgi:hypothetical protein
VLPAAGGGRHNRLRPALVCLLLLVAAWAWFADPAPSRAAKPAKPAKPPVLLLFHCGGFVWPCPSPCMPYAQAAGFFYGFEPRVVDYPLWSVPEAMRAAVAAVPPHRPAYAYGESAGGLLAARLAQRGSVRAAAVQSPVANLPFFIGLVQSGLVQSGSPFSISTLLDVPTLAEQRCYSPVHNRTRNPVFATAAMEDTLTPPTLRWARKARRVLAVTVPGDHLGSTGLLYPSRVQFLLGWLACRAGTRVCSNADLRPR